MSYGVQSMVDPLRRVLVRRPDAAFAVPDPRPWHYASTPDLPAAQAEHDTLVGLLREAGTEVLTYTTALPQHADAIYVFDPVLVTEHGTIVLSMGKSLRRGEEAALAQQLETHGVPTLARLEGDARAEGGDLLWLDRQTLVAGLGFRTNQAGVDQLRSCLSPFGVTVLTTELPYHHGPEACLHLLSSISLVDHDLAVVYPPLLTVPFMQLLRNRGIALVAVPDDEVATQAPNVLAVSPRRLIMLEGNPVTQEKLERAGCWVDTYRGREISLKAEGGPTCLTRPVWREPPS